MSEASELREAFIRIKLWSMKANSRLAGPESNPDGSPRWGWVEAEVRPGAVSMIHPVENGNFRIIIDGFEFVAAGGDGAYDKVRGLLLAHG